MAKENAINNISGSLTIDSGASGDSFVQFDINGTGEFRVGCDDTDDSYRISQGSALGTNDTFVVTDAGIITKPLQPSFLNIINAESNVSGDATAHDVGSVTATTSIADRGSDMTEGDGAGTGATFTAPVAGIYQFCFGLQIDIDATGGDTLTVQIVTSNRTFPVTVYPTENLVSGLFGVGGDLMWEGTVIEELAASDTVVFRFTCTGGSKVDDIVDGYISGVLLM